MMLQMILFETYGYRYPDREIGEESKQLIVHRSGMAKGQIVRNFMNGWKENANFQSRIYKIAMINDLTIKSSK